MVDAITDPWLVIGDFNSVSSQLEKRGGLPFASSSKSGLLHFMNTSGMVDLGFNGNLFTSNNGRMGGANIRERLDPNLANPAWRVLFPTASILHAPVTVSDHLPLILNSEGHNNLPRHPFKLEAMWPCGYVILEAFIQSLLYGTCTCLVTRL